MAIEDLDTLKAELPELFEDMMPPLGEYEDEYILVPLDELEIDLSEDQLTDIVDVWPREPLIQSPLTETAAPISVSQFPGGPVTTWKSPYPPPDALAFYLPFHYFHPVWWGIYLTVEGVYSLARFIHLETRGLVSVGEAFQVAKIYLYGHEVFHHIVESFATRLEVTHRIPLYKNGFEALYRKTAGSDDCMEESLACAHGFYMVLDRSTLAQTDPDKHEAAYSALLTYIDGCPEGYRIGSEIIIADTYYGERSIFAEDNHVSCFGSPKRDPSLWGNFPYAFSGFGNVRSRNNYIVRKNSPLLHRIKLRVRYFSYRDVTKGLEKRGCKFKRQGRGSHEIWVTEDGKRVVVPRHPRDITEGTIKSIIKQAGLGMSTSEFLSY